MTILASLTNRIFLASAALAVLSIGVAVYFVSVATTREAEAELQRGLIEAGSLVDQHRATQVQNFTVMARLVADLPRLKAAVETGDPPTVEPLAADYQAQLGSHLLVVTDRGGRVLASAGTPGIAELGSRVEIQRALEGRAASGLWPYPDGALQVVTVPIAIGVDRPELLGTLTVGFRLDNALAAQFKRLTDSEIAFAVDGQIRASTLQTTDQPRLADLLGSTGISRIALNDSEYVALLRPLSPAIPISGQPTPIAPASGAATSVRHAPTVIILRSRTERLRFLTAIRTGLAGTAVVAVLLATILSYAVARTITRPLATITDAMREMARTGDLARKVPLPSAGGWQDEDAQLLMTTFNTLTDSIARFQREASQRERLSSLGRLSTVIAHEIRNPLMIIKASLRTLGSERATPPERREALTDVDEEVSRLNRVVNDVLDFARPIRFEYAEADLNAICADAVQATRTLEGDPTIRITPDSSLPAVATDAERLRTALVNILTNARHAVEARGASNQASSQASSGGVAIGADIEVVTMRPGPGRTAIVIKDRGIGIRPEDLSRIFDPYFTTKRTGSGLGLAIAKNIVEGLGGSILIESSAAEGTTIRLELPERAHGAA